MNKKLLVLLVCFLFFYGLGCWCLFTFVFFGLDYSFLLGLTPKLELNVNYFFICNLFCDCVREMNITSYYWCLCYE